MEEPLFTTIDKINWLIDRKKYPLAEQMALRLIASYPTFCYGYFALVRAYLNQEKFDQAKTTLQQLVEIGSDFAHTYYLFAFLYFRLNRLQDALTAIKKALQLEPENTDYQYQKALILCSFPRFKEAKEICEHSLTIDPEQAKVMTLLGYCYSALGETSKAEALFEVVQKKYPNYADLYAKKGMIAMRKGNNEEAIRLFKEALRLNPEFPSVIHHLNTLKGYYSWTKGNREREPFLNPYEKKEISLKAYRSWMKDEREQYYNLSYLFAFLMIFLGPSKDNIYIALGVVLGLLMLPALLFIASVIFARIRAEVRKTRTSPLDHKLEAAFAGIGVGLSALIYLLRLENHLLEIVEVSTLFLLFSVVKLPYAFSIKDRLYKGKVGFSIALHLGFILGLWFFTMLSGADVITHIAFAFGVVITITVAYKCLTEET